MYDICCGQFKPALQACRLQPNHDTDSQLIFDGFGRKHEGMLHEFVDFELLYRRLNPLRRGFVMTTFRAACVMQSVRGSYLLITTLIASNPYPPGR